MSDDNAKILFEFLKGKEKLSGGFVKDELALSDGKYRLAKQRLKELGLVVLGRGRGGTIQAVEGAEYPEEKKLSKEEIAERARRGREAAAQERKYQSRIKRERDKRIEQAVAEAAKDHPEYECNFHAMAVNDDIVYVEIWTEAKKAIVLPY